MILRTRHRVSAFAGTLSIAVASLVATAAPAHAQFPGQNGRIFYNNRGPTSNSDIFSANPDGSDPKDVTASPDVDESFPAVSPDGTRMVYTLQSYDNQGDSFLGIDESNSDGSDQITLIQPTQYADLAFLSWSPDGTQIIFGGRNALDVMNADGSNLHAIYSGSEIDISGASWSPDGSTIAFGLFDGDTGFSSIDTIHPDGSGFATLVQGSSSTAYFFPDYSPDGKHLLVEDYGNDNPDDLLVEYDADGSSPIDLTPPSEYVSAGGVWSPDGTQIAFYGDLGSAYTINVMNANGSNAHPIITPTGSTPFLSWVSSGPPITPVPQRITFTKPADVTYSPGGTDPVSATASSGLPVSFSSTSAACTVASSGLVTINSAGQCVIAADQSGNESYLAAPTVTRTLKITRAATPITLAPLSTQVLGSTTPISVTGDGATTAVKLSAAPSDVCVIKSGAVVAKGVGTCTVTANQAGDTNYVAAAPVSTSFAIAYVTQTLQVTVKGGKTRTATFDIQLTNVAGNNQGSASIAVSALTLDGSPFATTDGTEPFTYTTAGKKYVLTISTQGLPAATHVVTYQAGVDPTMHTVTFITQ